MSTTITRPSTVLKDRDRKILGDLFQIDTRALTAVRIGLAVIILVHSFTSPLPADPGSGFQLLIDYAMVLIVPFAVMLLLGYRTRLATIVCWVLYGLQLRQGYFSGDGRLGLESYMVSLFLFWGAFLPMASHLSLDAKAGRAGTSKGLVLSVASAGFLLQMFIIYFSAGATKYLTEWVVEANALEYVMATKYASDLGREMLAFPTILAVASVATVTLEILGSVLLFIPGRTLAIRRLFITFAFIAFHVSLAVFMALGRFAYVMIVVWLVFLPPGFWDLLTRRPMPLTQFLDTNRLRNTVASLALIYVAVSCVFTWLYYPSMEGFAGAWQQFGKYLLIYQQWAMFSVPSSL